MTTSFSGGRSQSTRKELPTMGKQLVNFIRINTNRYCGSTTPTNITSTGTTLTVEMITDNSAIYRGFDLLLSAYSDGMDVMFLIIEQAY
jgi:hypothetical protein